MGFKPALAVLCILPVSAMGADLKLSGYAGEWRGTGRYERQTSTQSQGKLTCKLTIVAPSDNEMVINGRCAAPEGSQGFTTSVTATGANLLGRDSSTNRSSQGTLGSNGFTLTGQDAKGSTSFSLGSPLDGTMRMISSSEEAKESSSANVILVRRK